MVVAHREYFGKYSTRKVDEPTRECTINSETCLSPMIDLSLQRRRYLLVSRSKGTAARGSIDRPRDTYQRTVD